MAREIETIAEEIREAARRLDREEVAALCRQVIDEARRRTLPEKPVVGILGVLQRKRYFDLLQSVGDALVETGQATPAVRRRWVQSLIDQNKLDQALAEVERLIPDTVGDRRENPEARGLLGRVLKQRYVRSLDPGKTRDDAALRRAVETYAAAYDENREERAWHGINTVALLARARADGVRDVPEPESPRQLASELLRRVEGRGAGMDAWALATGLEACVALDDRDAAVRWANGYVAHPGADAFEIASTLRQMEEVWRLDPSDGRMGAAVLPILRSGLLRREDGSIEVTPGEVRGLPALERVLGRESYVSLVWYRRGLERARGVARISRPMGEPRGTGFLVRGRDLAPGLPDEWLLLTNHHVVNDDERDRDALRPSEARVTFSALGDDERSRPCALRGPSLWSSKALDATLLRLAEPPAGVDSLPPCEVAGLLPEPGEHTRVYVIGHPRGEILSFSIHDNQLLAHDGTRLHYRAPTEPGSSGSPVFDGEWRLIALHHAGGTDVDRLDGAGRYAANEGFSIHAIRAAVGGGRPPAAAPRTPPLHSSREKSAMSSLESRVRNAVREIQRRDGEVGREMEDRREEAREEARRVVERVSFEAFAAPERAPDLAQETIVLRMGRPVLRISRDQAVLEFSAADSRVWRRRLEGARDLLLPAVRAVGRVEVEGHQLDWLGTGVLVAENVVATNRHVASEFGRRRGAGFVFRRSPLTGRDMAASVDFLEELGREESLAFRIGRILHIEDEDGPDLALLEVEPADRGRMATPVRLARDVAPDRFVAVVGYPARDSRIPDQKLMDQIFGDVYDKKRLAPGQLIGVERDELRHDCSTLGGNSGSPVYDLETGEVVGLHFAGRFLEANFAVPAPLVADRLSAVQRPGPVAPPRRPSESGGDPTHRAEVTVPLEGTLATVTIPIHVTVTVGAPVVDAGGGSGAAPPPRGPSAGDDDEDPMEPEGRPEDYADRRGYEAGFLGSGASVPLPRPRAEDDVLTFRLNGREESELRYQHFSVVMSRSRRLCLLSAVNIHGRESRKAKRVGWRMDPRIPQKAQIQGECYGSPPKFSRGHMTRREDPVWGDRAGVGNADSMHVTNAVPQMQDFNAGIWLKLEDYALDHARGDDMRISVFTGPIFRPDDPARYGVKIPVSFWKVIAFIHDGTGKLSATGYTMSQVDSLRPEEFVFGQFGTSQCPIAWIEEQTGLSFGELTRVDPLRDARESRPTPLTRPEAIRFV